MKTATIILAILLAVMLIIRLSEIAFRICDPSTHPYCAICGKDIFLGIQKFVSDKIICDKCYDEKYLKKRPKPI